MRDKYHLHNINEGQILWDKYIVDLLEIFYTLTGVKRQISLTLMFYVKSHNNK